MANENEFKETIDASVEQATASQKLDKKAKQQSKKKARKIVFKILLVVIILFLVNVYIILSLMYKGENF